MTTFWKAPPALRFASRTSHSDDCVPSPLYCSMRHAFGVSATDVKHGLVMLDLDLCQLRAMDT